MAHRLPVTGWPSARDGPALPPSASTMSTRLDNTICYAPLPSLADSRLARTSGVSVIIAARNAAATIGATLDSVAHQTHTVWEAIVIDDGSTDGTRVPEDLSDALSAQ